MHLFIPHFPTISNTCCQYILVQCAGSVLYHQMWTFILLCSLLQQGTDGQYSGQGYTSVPVLPDVQEIDLSDNDIGDIGSDFSNNYALEVLNMQSNVLTSFPDFTDTPIYCKYNLTITTVLLKCKI